MMTTNVRDVPAEELAALEGGHAFVDLSAWRKVRVSGSDAAAWLGDLLTADIAALDVGHGCRSLLLTPTGRIRADVRVARRAEDLVLVQAPDQPEHVGLALSAYVLSSDVSLEDRTNDQALFAIPGSASSRVGFPGATQPSSVGPGIDVLVDAGKPAWRVADALEIWRIRRGDPRMGYDFDDRSLPAEAGLEHVIASDKGCFLGQEAVARVRNLGHPPRVLRHLVGTGPIVGGEAVYDGNRSVGEVTSAVVDDPESTVIARLGWDARAHALTLRDGRPLRDVPGRV